MKLIVNRNPRKKESARLVNFSAIGPDVREDDGGIDITTCSPQLIAVRDWLDEHSSSEDEVRAYRTVADLKDPATADSARAELARLQKRGSVLAAFFLGRMHLEGLRAEKDEKKGRALLEEAANRDFGPACFELFHSGWGDMAPDGGAEALTDSIGWLMRGLELNSPSCALFLGFACLSGTFPHKRAVLDDVLATLAPFAARGSWPCLETMIRLLMQNGRGDDAQGESALASLKALAERDFAPAQGLLGELCAKGFLVRKSDTQAVKWLKKAWQQNDSQAGLLLAELLVAGHPEGRKRDQCFDILRPLCGEGIGRAHALLARLLEQSGSEADWRESLVQYGKAIDLGSPGEAVRAAWAMVMAPRSEAMRRMGLTLLEKAAECDPPLPDIPDGPFDEETRAQALKKLALRPLAAPGRPLNGEAMVCLARLRLNGMDGRAASAEEGLAMLEKAADNDCAQAMGELAGISFAGLYGVKADPEKAEDWARRGWAYSDSRCGALLAARGLLDAPAGDDEASLVLALISLQQMIGLEDSLHSLDRRVFSHVAAAVEAAEEEEEWDEDEDGEAVFGDDEEEEYVEDSPERRTAGPAAGDDEEEDDEDDEEDWEELEYDGDDEDDEEEDEEEGDEDEDDEDGELVLDGSDEAMERAFEMGVVMADSFLDGVTHLDMALVDMVA
ncbi:MAG: hypothetical protein Q4F72_09175, partial [Desulfovibrionaceae bacterium]|nr:hypothetical protein [Desulfovibrionaceae bacterium]